MSRLLLINHNLIFQNQNCCSTLQLWYIIIWQDMKCFACNLIFLQDYFVKQSVWQGNKIVAAVIIFQSCKILSVRSVTSVQSFSILKASNWQICYSSCPTWIAFHVSSSSTKAALCIVLLWVCFQSVIDCQNLKMPEKSRKLWCLKSDMWTLNLTLTL